MNPLPSDARADKAPYISVVIPMLNEQGSLPQLYRELTDVLGGLKRTYEIVFVDDGSSDGAVEVAMSMVKTDPHVVLVQLRRRFGKAAALQVGFETAGGEVVLTLDGDLQDNPYDIPALLAPAR